MCSVIEMINSKFSVDICILYEISKSHYYSYLSLLITLYVYLSNYFTSTSIVEIKFKGLEDLNLSMSEKVVVWNKIEIFK